MYLAFGVHGDQGLASLLTLIIRIAIRIRRLHEKMVKRVFLGIAVCYRYQLYPSHYNVHDEKSGGD